MLRPARALIGALLSTLGALACTDASRTAGPETQSILGVRHGIANISDGNAVIMKSRLGSGYCAAGASAAGSEMTSTSCVGGLDQQFTWQTTGEVKAYGSMCVTAVPASGTTPARVVLQSCSGAATQKWTLTGPGEIRNASNQCVAGDVSVEAPGAKLLLKSCDGSLGTMWEPWTVPANAPTPPATSPAPSTTVDPAAVMMKSRLGMGYCAASASAAGSSLTANACVGAGDEQAVWQSTGEVKLYGTMCVTEVAATGKVTLLACDGSAAQKWSFSSKGEIRGTNGQCVAATTAETPGSALFLKTCDGSLATLWEKWPIPAGQTPAPALPTPIAPVPPPSSIVAPPSTVTAIAAPELPRTYLNSAYVAPTGRTITVNAGGDLQGAINSAQAGDVIVIQAGATFTGNFILPNKSGSGWITIRSSSEGSLPAAGTRVTPAHASLMPKLVTPNVSPVIATAPGAHHYRLVGLDVSTPSTTWLYSLIALGDVGVNQNTLSQVPHDIVLDRMYVHGNATVDLRRCIGLNSASTAIVDSWIADCHSRTNDSQAIAGWNGPGPFKIVNNYLEGATENVMFGGSDPSISGLVPSDIEFRRNHVFKPLSWQGRWSVKNLFELKMGKRVLVEGNVFENNWQDAQVGFAITLKSVNQDGTAPWSETSDVTFQYNIIRAVAGGLSLSGAPESYPAVRMSRVRISNNSWERVGDPSLGAAFTMGRLYQIENTTALELSHNSGTGTQHGLILLGNPSSGGFILRDNVLGGGVGITSADGKGVGMDALNYHTPGWQAKGNVVGTSYMYNLVPFPTGNTYVANGSTAGATAQTTDGRPVGVDVATLSQKTAGVIINQ